jgi:hypothetical protein
MARTQQHKTGKTQPPSNPVHPIRSRRALEATRRHNPDRSKPRAERRYAWSEDRVKRDSFDPAPSDPCDALNRHQRQLQTQAFHFLGASSAANALLGYVRGGPLAIPGAIASSAAPLNAGASSIAARIHGDDQWKTARARDNAFTRHVDVPLDGTFYFYRDITGTD